jgi:hypothetical protein
LAHDMRQDPNAFAPLLQWGREPSYEQLVGVCGLIREYQLAGVVRGLSDKQAAFLILSKLKKHSPLNEVIRDQVKFLNGDTEAGVGAVLRFVRNYAMFNFPKALRALDRIQAEVFPSIGRAAGSFETFARRVESLFYPAFVTALDEYGVPFPLATRVARFLSAHAELDDVLDWLRGVDVSTLRGLTPFEKELLVAAQQGL